MLRLIYFLCKRTNGHGVGVEFFSFLRIEEDPDVMDSLS